jgi:acyl CoA:acetate/3-ketoacid CoA transferase alpha subunit
MKHVPVAEAIAIIPDGSTLIIGGFKGVGTPDRLIDELVRQCKRNLALQAFSDHGDVSPALRQRRTRTCTVRSRKD